MTIEYEATKPLSDAEQSNDRSAIGRYQIQRMLGRGGMGIVVAARDPELDRMVAVKILVDSGRPAGELGAALRREAQALARVHHPNVLAVYDAGVDGAPFLVMQLVEGETLGAYLERVKPKPRETIAMFLQAARGLAAIHAARLIHRDFKPSNALVDRAGVVWVADLGLARIGELALTAAEGVSTPTAQATTLAGTPAYMAPEQFEHMELTPACDQFSFCVALWEALAGRRPFSGATENELARAVKAGPPRELDVDGVSARQVQALRRGLSADPAARFPSMDALAAALTPPSRRPFLLVGGGVLAAGAAVAGVIAMRDDSPPPPPPAPVVQVVAPPVVDAKPARTQLVLSDAHRLTLTDACDEFPSLGPDGTIYYDGVVGPDSHLMAIEPETRKIRELTTTKGWDLAPSVSPDGKQLVFLRKTDAAMAAHIAPVADLGAAKPIVPGGFRPSWSPNGKNVWAGGRKGISRYDAATLEVNRTLDLPAGAFPMAALELPDTRVVLLTRSGTANADGLAIYDAGSKTPRWLLPGSDDNPMDEVLTLTPEGDAVLVGRYTVTFNLELWHVPLDGSPPEVISGAAINASKRLVIAGRRLVWSDCADFISIASPELTRTGATKLVDLARNKWVDHNPMGIPGTDEILFLSYRSQEPRVWRMTRTGEGATMVPFGDLELDRAALSHDGKLLAAATADALFVGPVDGSWPPRKLVAIPDSEHNATFSRDNKQVYFESKDGERDRIAAISIEGGTPTWVTPVGSVAPVQVPTADALAYLAEDPSGPLHRVVMLLDQKTGATRRAMPDLAPYPFRYMTASPDGTRLLVGRRDGRVVEIDLAKRRVLRTFDMGANQMFGLTYAGDQILFGRGGSAGDIWEAVLR